MAYLIGIDVGTSGTKTVLFDYNGRAVKSKTVEYGIKQPQNGWAEQNPDDWWQAAVIGIRTVLCGVEPSSISAIGLSGQMHGLVMLGKDNEVLRPAIIWCDQRSAAECAEMESVVGKSRIIEIAANPPMTGFTASKLLWVRNNESDIYEKCVKILLPKDYIRFKLTGEFATDVSDASGMQFMDVGARSWSPEILEKLKIDSSVLPTLYESPEITGKVTRNATLETGLKPGTPVVGGAGDNAAAAIGCGVVSEGRAFTSLGSSAVIYAVTDSLRTDYEGRVHGLCAGVPGKWTVMSCTQGAGISLKWLAENCGFSESGKKSRYAVMDEMAENIPIGAEKLLYLPYLMGERSPHPDPFCRGVFFGLSAVHGKAHMVRAVMEGVAFSQKECLDVFRQNGVEVNDMIVIGGGARSGLWRQMLSDLYGCPVSVLESDEGAALGAALLSGIGIGVYADAEQASTAAVRKIPSQVPDVSSARLYESYFGIYKRLYLKLADEFKLLHSL